MINQLSCSAISSDVYVHFDPTQLIATDCFPGDGSAGDAKFKFSPFACNLLNNISQVHVGGLYQKPDSTSSFILATIIFTKVQTSNILIKLDTTIKSLGSSDTAVNLVNHDLTYGLPAIAGSFWFAAGSGPSYAFNSLTFSRRRSVALGSDFGMKTRRQFPKCTLLPPLYLPCCIGSRELGDVNGDCIFDLTDVDLLSAKVLGGLNDFVSANIGVCFIKSLHNNIIYHHII